MMDGPRPSNTNVGSIKRAVKSSCDKPNLCLKLASYIIIAYKEKWANMYWETSKQEAISNKIAMASGNDE